MKTKFLVCAALACMLISIDAAAQLRFNGNKIAFDTSFSDQVDINVTGSEGLGWYYTPSNSSTSTLTSFSIKLTGSYPNLFSSSGVVRFMDSRTSTYNTLRCASYNTLSDMRAKVDIRPIAESLEGIVALNDNAQAEEGFQAMATSTQQANGDSMAERLRTLYPSLVSEDEDGNLLVNYVELIPLLVDAVKQLEEKALLQSQVIKTLQASIENQN